MRELILRYPAPFPPLPEQMPEHAEALATRALDRVATFKGIGVRARYWRDEGNIEAGPERVENRLGRCATPPQQHPDGSEYQRVWVTDAEAEKILEETSGYFSVVWDSEEYLIVLDENEETILLPPPEPQWTEEVTDESGTREITVRIGVF